MTHPKAGRVFRIGYLGDAALPDHVSDAFRQGLQQHGYVEGKNLSIELRYTGGRNERLPSLAAELAQLNLDLIVAQTSQAARAAKETTPTTPVVMAGVADPVGRGFATSLAHPGGNMTGVFDLQVDLIPKRLEWLKAAVPKVSRVVMLTNPAGIDPMRLAANRDEQAAAARGLGVTLMRVELDSPEDLEKAVAEAGSLHPDALLLAPTAVNFILRAEIAKYSAAHRLPTIRSRREQAEAGMLLSYGTNLADTYRNVAEYVAKILDGAKPGDLPIEQGKKFELVINLRIAKALRLTIPQSLMQRADDVIQ